MTIRNKLMAKMIYSLTILSVPIAANSFSIRGFNGKCLNVIDSNVKNGTPVVWDCGAYNSQTWSYVNRNLIGIDGRCIDVFDSNSVNGATVENWTCSATASWQQWSMQ